MAKWNAAPNKIMLWEKNDWNCSKVNMTMISPSQQQLILILKVIRMVNSRWFDGFFEQS